MEIVLLKSKIHRARVTSACIDYEGSLSIAADFMEKVGLQPFERILCGNLENGQRFETYAIPGRAQSREVVLNGATAHLGKVGDRLTIMSFARLTPDEARSWAPKVIVLGEENAIVSERGL